MSNYISQELEKNKTELEGEGVLDTVWSQTRLQINIHVGFVL